MFNCVPKATVDCQALSVCIIGYQLGMVPWMSMLSLLTLCSIATKPCMVWQGQLKAWLVHHSDVMLGSYCACTVPCSQNMSARKHTCMHHPIHMSWPVTPSQVCA